MSGAAVVLYKSGDDMDSDRVLAVLQATQSQLASINTVEQAKEVSDQAAALLAYAKRASLGLEVQNRTACLRLTAERQAGILLERTERLKGRPAKDSLVQRLSERGINYNQSYRWRTLARLSDGSLEYMRQECDRCGDELTASYAIRSLRWRLSPEEYGKVMRPWEDWSDRPHDKEVLDAINYLFRHLAAVLKPGRDAEKKMQVVLRDETYLTNYDREQLREALLEVRARLSRWVVTLERRLGGYPADPHEDGPGLLAFVGETVESWRRRRKQHGFGRTRRRPFRTASPECTLSDSESQSRG